MNNISLANGKKIKDVRAIARKNANYKKYKSDALARIKLAELLHAKRTARKVSMRELAKLANTTPAIVSRIEHAESSVGIDLVARLFSALGVKKLILPIA